MDGRNNGNSRLLLGIFASQLLCFPAAAVELTGSVRLHDPSRILKEGDRYFTYHTGSAAAPLGSKLSDNFTDWQTGPAVFGSIPAWARAEVNSSATNMWAPDVFHFNDEYRLYYSVSTFGSQNSVIGVATNSTLDFNDPNYAWIDQQMVIESENGSPFNAIDPAIFHDESTNRMWMTFGSFWQGLFITELNPATGKRITTNSPTTNIAKNADVTPNAIEAPYLTKHDDSYYLFVNWDTCCQGSNSTYNIRVGRGTSPTGPFVDRNGIAMTAGGGELFLATEGTKIGPGHFSEYSEDNVDYFSYHYYDGADQGRSKLAIEEFAWTFDGWPILVSDLPTGDYNRNGIVDAADYTVWRNTLGSTGDLRANGDNSEGSVGIVNMADYFAWRNNYGAAYNDPPGAGSSANFAAIPEPASIYVAVTAGVILCLIRLRGDSLCERSRN